MGWLLGLLGIGGIGAALFFIPGLAARALEVLKGLVGIVASYPWQAGCAVLILLAVWTWHGWSKADATVAAQAKTIKATNDKLALTTSQRDQAVKAVADQNAAIDALAQAGTAKQQAATAALAGAQARLATAEAHARRIEQNVLREARGGPDCKTSQDIIDAKGDL